MGSGQFVLHEQKHPAEAVSHRLGFFAMRCIKEATAASRRNSSEPGTFNKRSSQN
jgi:hypothetical protein